MVVYIVRTKESSKMDNVRCGVKKSVKNYGYCGIIRKRDFEDRHPVIAGVMSLAAIVIVGAIVMVI